jgi:AcrR family transcriptional regulator
MTQPLPPRGNPERAHRILDATGELLLNWGYKRVTIEDVARRAGVGKGTVYLHWRTKSDLFAALLIREAAAVLAEQLEVMRTDPAETTLHRSLRSMFLIVMQRPLARAFYTGDTELLGTLCADTKIGLQAQQDKRAMVPQYHTVLRAHGMLRQQEDQRMLRYALHAAASGFFLLERAPFTDEGLSPGGEGRRARRHRSQRLRARPAAERGATRRCRARSDRALRADAHRSHPPPSRREPLQHHDMNRGHFHDRHRKRRPCRVFTSRGRARAPALAAGDARRASGLA